MSNNLLKELLPPFIKSKKVLFLRHEDKDEHEADEDDSDDDDEEDQYKDF